jgi:hypothetical protein
MDLITLQEYKNYKKINNPEKDAVLSTVITSVSNLIKVYCGKTFIDHYDTPITEVRTIKDGMDAVVLSEYPLRVVSAVTAKGVDITPDITVDADMGIISSAPNFLTPGVDVLSVTYTGGYEETPADVKLACFELVDYYVQGEHKSRKTFGGSSVEYHQSVNEWPFHIQSILDMYRDV